jgi:hypothetical protein
MKGKSREGRWGRKRTLSSSCTKDCTLHNSRTGSKFTPTTSHVWHMRKTGWTLVHIRKPWLQLQYKNNYIIIAILPTCLLLPPLSHFYLAWPCECRVEGNRWPTRNLKLSSKPNLASLFPFWSYPLTWSALLQQLPQLEVSLCPHLYEHVWTQREKITKATLAVQLSKLFPDMQYPPLHTSRLRNFKDG